MGETRFERPQTVVRYIMEARRHTVSEVCAILREMQRDHSFTNVDDEQVFKAALERIARLNG